MIIIIRFRNEWVMTRPVQRGKGRLYMERTFYRCETCGNLVGVIEDAKVPMMCCGKPMTKLEPNTKDAAQEKHVPVAEISGDKLTVKVGEAPHPMTPEHYIQWIMINQGAKTQRMELTPTDAPEACFVIEPDKELHVYAYCNLHGLWKMEEK